MISHSKYHAKRTSLDGIEFDSKKEAYRWAELKLLEKAGEITELKRQVAFELIPSQRDDRGKVIERCVVYNADFSYKDKLGRLIVEDTKSPATRTPAYIIKRKLMLYVHGIKIKEV